MIPWWWLIPAVMIGATAGVFFIALVSTDRTTWED